MGAGENQVQCIRRTRVVGTRMLLSSSMTKMDGLYASEYGFAKGNGRFSTMCLHRVLRIWGDAQLKDLLCQHEALK